MATHREVLAHSSFKLIFELKIFKNFTFKHFFVILNRYQRRYKNKCESIASKTCEGIYARTRRGIGEPKSAFIFFCFIAAIH